MSRGLVLLLRSGESDDPYERLLTAQGFQARSMAVLDVEMVDPDGLSTTLLHPEVYGAVVFTSSRAVDAFGDALAWLPAECAGWRILPVYAVGPATARALRDLGFESRGEECGSAASLAEVILRNAFDRPILFLCGNRRRDDLPQELRKAGIEVEERCVYRTAARTGVSWPPEDPPDWVVFFSPSGYEAFHSGPALDGIRIAAIGSTTAAALRAKGLVVDAVADEPSPDAVAACISIAAP